MCELSLHWIAQPLAKPADHTDPSPPLNDRRRSRAIGPSLASSRRTPRDIFELLPAAPVLANVDDLMRQAATMPA
jgi:hypothetical protein